MKTDPQSRSLARRTTRGLLRGGAMLGFGVLAFYALTMVDRLFLQGEPDPPSVSLPLATASPAAVPPGEGRRGNAWILQARTSLEQRHSVQADVVQLGWVAGSALETHGRYQQQGQGKRRQFALQLQGQMAGRATRLLRVSDGRSLWTDLLWQGEEESVGRNVARIDLRRLRQANASHRTPSPGEAAPLLAGAAGVARLGGLPMLLASLDESFDFAPGRRMQLRGEPVIALVGQWNRRRSDELGFDSSAEPSLHVPDHVVVALSETTHFPLMIEYRSANDPLASPRMAEDERLRPSNQPMLKIDYLQVQFDQEIPVSQFSYSPPAGVDWHDRTEHEIGLDSRRHERNSLAASEREMR